MKKVRTGFHSIEVQIEPHRWVSISAGDFWFGFGYPDSKIVAFEKASNRLTDRKRADPNRTYRIVTKYED